MVKSNQIELLLKFPPAGEKAQIFRQIIAEAPRLPYGAGVVHLLGVNFHSVVPRTAVRPHRHSHYEAILILRGRGRETTPPFRVLRAGMMQLYAPDILHAWQAGPVPVSRIGFRFLFHPPTAATIPDRWPKSQFFVSDFLALMEEARSRSNGRAERVAARIILLLAPVLGLLQLPEVSPVITMPEKISMAPTVDKFLTDNIEMPLSLADVAIQLHMSVPTLTRHYRRETGCAVMERLQALRMARAADLLRTEPLSVKQVAGRVGFRDCAYFCRCFRLFFGRTPGAFSRS
ncbi:MAG: helix-turn-helix transcriptional regulator [Kiritimatiellia bacterium]|nr:helix-turn-helix transcriptional regulator [Kiritimatiellia bacterium]